MGVCERLIGSMYSRSSVMLQDFGKARKRSVYKMGLMVSVLGNKNWYCSHQNARGDILCHLIY